MSRLHRKDYIRLRIASLPSVELEEIIAYVQHCKESGVRLCNDKFLIRALKEHILVSIKKLVGLLT